MALCRRRFCTWMTASTVHFRQTTNAYKSDVVRQTSNINLRLTVLADALRLPLINQHGSLPHHPYKPLLFPFCHRSYHGLPQSRTQVIASQFTTTRECGVVIRQSRVSVCRVRALTYQCHYMDIAPITFHDCLSEWFATNYMYSSRCCRRRPVTQKSVYINDIVHNQNLVQRLLISTVFIAFIFLCFISAVYVYRPTVVAIYQLEFYTNIRTCTFYFTTLCICIWIYTIFIWHAGAPS